MKVYPKTKEEIDLEANDKTFSKRLSILFVFLGTFGFFVKILFF
jgi:hypothetical protein